MQVPRKKKDIKILHLENIYVIIIYKERGEIMGLFSRSKPKTEESEWVEWHPKKPAIKIKAIYFDQEKDNLKDGETWCAAYDFANLRNIIYIVNKVDDISNKLDKILAENKELKERCNLLESEIQVLKR